jgi:carbamoyl-phosphate synthase large subunit
VNQPVSVLVFPGGTEAGLEIRRALGLLKNIRLTSAGSGKSNHAPFVFERHYEIPTIHESDWIDRLNAIIGEQGIDYIFPAHDDVLVALVENATRIHAQILSSPLETCLITRSKSETYRVLQNVLPVPRLFASAGDVAEFPVFVKPDKGEGSRGARLVESEADLRDVLAKDPTLIIMENLPGPEYTVDCFSDRERGVLFSGGRERIRTRNGISVHSRPTRSPSFRDYAVRISGCLAIHGAWFFQVKQNTAGEFTLLEVAPRIAGTMALHRVLGVNFPLLALYEARREPLTIAPLDVAVEVDRALENRFRHNIVYDVVYVDLDDTLLLNGKVNLDVVRFLYQCHNNGKAIILLTKHAADLNATLDRHRLTGLFDKVIHCKSGDSKADCITASAAILIDDSFAERALVSRERGILTFDCSMLELLLEDRSA